MTYLPGNIPRVIISHFQIESNPGNGVCVFRGFGMLFPRRLEAQRQLHAVRLQERLVPKDGLGVAIRRDVSVRQQNYPLAGIQNHIQIMGSDDF